MEAPDEKWGLFFMFCLGALFCWIMVALMSDIIPGTHSYKARVLLEECENIIPRNQNCILIAIPEQK